MAVHLPKSLYPGLKHFIALTDSEADRFLDALELAKPAMLSIDMGTALARKLAIPEHDAQAISLFLVGLYSNATGSFLESGVFVDQLVESVSGEKGGVKPGPGGWEPIKTRLVRALTFDKSLGVSAKSIEIMTSQAHVFSDARVLTDIRPVFAPNTDDEPAGALIVHNLKLSYYAGDEPHDFFVSMDSADLLVLQDSLSRAMAKEASLDKIIKKGGLPRIDKEES